MITVTTSRRADPLVRRIGKDLAFASGGTYVTRGKGGLSRPPFSVGTVLVLSREGAGIRIQVITPEGEGTCLRFPVVTEIPRPGPLRRGLFTGDPCILSSLSSLVPLGSDGDHPDTLVMDGLQGRRISLGKRGEA